MSDLREILAERATTLAMSLRDAPEFDAIAAKRTVRRRRTSRATLIGAAAGVALIAVGGGAWVLANRDGSELIPPASPTPSATPSATPTPSSSPSVTPILYEGRNPKMSDAEALARSEAPATGEVWLAAAKAAHPGKWSKDPFWDGFDGSPVWMLVGSRDGNDILTERNNGYLVEVSSDGTPRLIVAPRPDQPGVSDGDDYPIDVDTVVYYDSLALPAVFTTSEGVVLNPRQAWGAAAAFADPSLNSVSAVTSFGTNALLRSSRPSDNESWGTGVANVLNGSTTDVRYLISTPYGATLYVPLDVAPIGSIEWSEPSASGKEPPLIDFFDQDCEVTPGPAVAITANAAGPWDVVGTSPTGDVMAPTASSKLAHAMYANYKDVFPYLSGDGPTPVLSYTDYLKAPAFVAVASADPDLWWLLLNKDLSARAWC